MNEILLTVLVCVGVFVALDVAGFIFYRRSVTRARIAEVEANRLLDLKQQFEATKKLLYDRAEVYRKLPTKAERQEAQKKDELVWIVDSYALMLKQWRKQVGVW